LKASYLEDQHTTQLLHSLQKGEPALKDFSFQQGLILRKDRLWIVKSSPFQHQLLHFIHTDLASGHSRYHKTFTETKQTFIGRECVLTSNSLCVSALSIRPTNMRRFSPQAWSSPCPFRRMYGLTYRWTSLKVFRFHTSFL
jgi:hypothetical protein